MSSNDLDTAIAAIAASLTRSVQQLSDAGTIDDVPSAELAAVGAFLLRYRRDSAALASTAFRVAVEALGASDRIALAEEFEVAVHVVDRWARGTATLPAEIATRVERWCSARVASDDGPRLHIPRGLLDSAGG